MSDNRLAEAVDIVARWIIAYQARNVDWSDSPEIGEDDWDTVRDRIAELTEGPAADEFDAAYDYLAARANKDAEL